MPVYQLPGSNAIETAERCPERVAGLVLAGCSAEPVGPVAAVFRGFAWGLEHAQRGGFGVVNRSFFRVRYGTRIAHGPLLVGIMSGVLGSQIGSRALGLLEQQVRFKAPVRIGDTIHVEGELESKKELDAATGLVVFNWKIVNQRGETAAIAKVRGEIWELYQGLKGYREHPEPSQRPRDEAFWQMDMMFLPMRHPIFASNDYLK